MVRRRPCAVSNHESPDAAILRDAGFAAPQDEDHCPLESRHEPSCNVHHRQPRRRRTRGRAAAREVFGNLGAGGDVCDFPGGEGFAAGAPGLRLHRGLRGGRHHRRSGRLVRGGSPVQKAAGAADPAHRHHPEQPASDRRQARRIHRAAFPRNLPPSKPSCGRSISARSSPTGCATASAARISRVLRCGCCPRRWRRRRIPG